MKLMLTFAAAVVMAAPAAAHLPANASKPKALYWTARAQEQNLEHARFFCTHAHWAEVRRWHCAARDWIARELRQTRETLAYRYPQSAICSTFGAWCSQALDVARCESGLSVTASNGQYLGLFQMGSFARSRYGHSWSALGQARAAYAYFRDSGYSWSPWECRP